MNLLDFVFRKPSCPHVLCIRLHLNMFLRLLRIYAPSSTMQLLQILSSNIFPSYLVVQTTRMTFSLPACHGWLYWHLYQQLPAHRRKLLGTTCMSNARANKQGKFTVMHFPSFRIFSYVVLSFAMCALIAMQRYNEISHWTCHRCHAHAQIGTTLKPSFCWTCAFKRRTSTTSTSLV